MRRYGVLMRAVVAAAGVIGIWASQAKATTVCGSVITNVAGATVVPFAGVPNGTVSYSVTATVQVRTPGLNLIKQANVTVQSQGGQVTFCITVLNDGCASAFNVMVSDQLPSYMTYMGPNTEWIRGAGLIEYRWYASGVGWQPYPSRPSVGVSTEALLVWHVDVVGVGKSGYLCYQASVR